MEPFRPARIEAALLIGLSGCLALAGCPSEGDENLGLLEPRLQSVDLKQAVRPRVFAQIAALPEKEVAARLGAHQLSARTKWTVEPPKREGVDTATEMLLQEVIVESDGRGAWHIMNANDHGYGYETYFVGGELYHRMRYGPFIRRPPEGDEMTRLLGAASDMGAALVQLLLPYLHLSESTKVMVEGRPAIKLAIGLSSSPRTERQDGLTPNKVWRKSVRVTALSGAAVLDSQKGVLLGLRLEGTFEAPRPGAGEQHKVVVAFNHRMTISSVGDKITLSAPAESIPTPQRPRPMLDRNELLSGLIEQER